MKIWDSPRTDKEAIRLLQDKGMFPKTKQKMRQWTQRDFIFFR